MVCSHYVLWRWGRSKRGEGEAYARRRKVEGMGKREGGRVEGRKEGGREGRK